MSDLMFVRTPHGLEIAQKATEGLVPVTLKAPTESSNPETGIPVSEMDSGPWTVVDYPHNTNVGVHSAEPVYRSRLRIYGNFETNEEKVEYAQWLAESLNRLASQERALGVAKESMRAVIDKVYTGDDRTVWNESAREVFDGLERALTQIEGEGEKISEA